MNSRPLVLIVSGPSGSGKIHAGAEASAASWHDAIGFVHHTSAPQDGKRRQMVQFRVRSRISADGRRGEFLEYAQVFGKNWYGTPRKWLDEAMAQHKDLVLEIDVQGALQVKQKLPDAIAIFVLAPSRADIEKRIRDRGQDSEDEIRRRLERARQEMLTYKKYDYAVINDDLERAGAEVQAIAVASRCRVAQRKSAFAKS